MWGSIVSVALPDKRAGPRESRLIGKTKRFKFNGTAAQTLRVLQKDTRCIAAERGGSNPQLPEHTGRPSAAAHATGESCVGAEPTASLGCWVNAQKRLELSNCCPRHHLLLMHLTISTVLTRLQPPPLSQLVMKPTNLSCRSCESSPVQFSQRAKRIITNNSMYPIAVPACMLPWQKSQHMW